MMKNKNKKIFKIKVYVLINMKLNEKNDNLNHTDLGHWFLIVRFFS